MVVVGWLAYLLSPNALHAEIAASEPIAAMRLGLCLLCEQAWSGPVSGKAHNIHAYAAQLFSGFSINAGAMTNKG